MKDILLWLMFLFYGFPLCSQIGINTNNPQGVFHIDAKGDTNGTSNVSDDLLVDKNGNLGIGTLSPTARLHIVSEGTSVSPLKIQDGNERLRRVLRSDGNGLGTWSSIVGDGVVGVLGAGATVYLPDLYYGSGGMKVANTDSYIDLPPGRWIAYATCVLPPIDLTKHFVTPIYWMRSCFHDVPTATSLNSFMSDIEQGSQISVGGWYDIPALISGFTVINNKTAATKRYYYMIGIISANTAIPYTVTIGGNTQPENNLVAFKLQ